MSYNTSAIERNCKLYKFGKVSNNIWNLNIPCNAKLVYVYLASNKESFHPSKKLIARSTGITARTAAITINTLKKYNMIKIQNTKEGSKDYYIFTDASLWSAPTYDDLEKHMKDPDFAQELLQKISAANDSTLVEKKYINNSTKTNSNIYTDVLGDIEIDNIEDYMN